MVSLAPTRPTSPAATGPPRLRTLPSRFSPGEGWITVFLHLAVVLAASWTVRRADWSPPTAIITQIAFCGFALGFVLAKARVLDVLGHLLSFWAGIGLVAWLSLRTFDDVAGGQRERFRYLVDLGVDWYRRTGSNPSLEERDLFVVVIGLTIWLMAYTSAWVLYRREWMTTSLILPGLIILVNLGYSPEGGTRPLVLFVVAGCVMATRHHAYRRDLLWSSSRMARPAELPWRFTTAGATIALTVALLAWTLPTSGRATVFNAIWQQIEQPWSTVQNQWEHLVDRLNPDARNSAGSYSSFGEAFDLGGALNLSDDPVAVLEATQSTYLVAHRYDDYNGHGWSSRVEETFQPVGPDGERYSPQMTFAKDQGIHLSTQVTRGRREVPGTIRMLSPKDDLLLTTYTHLATQDLRTSVQLSWRQLDDEQIRIQEVKTSDVPPDLRQLFNLLKSTQFGVSPDGSFVAVDPAVSAEQAELAGRFLQTSWDVGADGRAYLLHVSGQVPVYDDVEAVFSMPAVSADQPYELKGLESQANPEELRAAPTIYPDYVATRYLQLPSTVTQRTLDLAVDVTVGAATPFDQAMAVQEFLRGAITYEEDIENPPRDQDVVDFVLFDSKEGYCEYYASAMTVMMRSLGVPARVAVGYFPAAYDGPRQGYLYRERNAHAWVEVYIPEYGWIPFEPTSSQPPIDYGGEPLPLLAIATPEPAMEPTPAAAALPTPTPTPLAGGTIQHEPPSDPSLLDRAPGPLGLVTIGIGAMVVLGAIAAGAVWIWGLRGLSPAGAFYRRVLRAGKWWGIDADPTTTPAEYATRLGHAVPVALIPARTVADLYAREQYAGRPLRPQDATAGRTAWSHLRSALVRSIVHRRRGRRGTRDG